MDEMRAGLSPPARLVPILLKQPQSRDQIDGSDDGAGGWIKRLVGQRAQFGITRIGSITRLDRIDVPVVQVVRPLSLSNAVSQGKGSTWMQAAASAMMEAIESWAGENILPERLRHASADNLGPGIRACYEPWLAGEASDDWDRRPLSWLDGWDLFTGRTMPVPAALVDTVYTLPSPHPILFPRTTTGLGAGRTFVQAVLQAGLEVLERDAIAEAHRTPHFFDLHQMSLPDGGSGPCADLLARVREADLLCGLWQAPAVHDLPVYWCHLMERGPPHELVPLPSEGFGCGPTHEEAVRKAVLEACQARATAIAGAREDLTRQHYPDSYDRAHLAEWREQLSAPRRLRMFPAAEPAGEACDETRLEQALEGLRQAGAEAAIIVPLLSDRESEIHVVRLVAPPLRLNPRAST
jgi:ribosomal protein S12 methylthiotransferase accessory factor